MSTRLIPIVCVFLTTMLSSLFAQPPLPSGYYGTVTVGGSPAPVGAVISARIDGVNNPTDFIVHTAGQYGVLSINGDISTTVEKEGGVQGDVVSFTITVGSRTFDAEETGVWEGGENHELNLSTREMERTQVLASGCARLSGENICMHGTVGQTFIGVMANTSTIYEVGFWPQIPVAPPCPSCERGDVNCDGEIDVFDLLEVVNEILNPCNLDDQAKERADCNLDGFIDVLDLVGIVNVILGTGTCPP